MTLLIIISRRQLETEHSRTTDILCLDVKLSILDIFFPKADIVSILGHLAVSQP